MHIDESPVEMSNGFETKPKTNKQSYYIELKMFDIQSTMGDDRSVDNVFGRRFCGSEVNKETMFI